MTSNNLQCETGFPAEANSQEKINKFNFLSANKISVLQNQSIGAPVLI